MKAFLRSDFGQRAVAWLVANWIRFVYRTTRWTIIDEHHVSDLVKSGRPFIVCFWHSRMMPFPMLLRRHGFAVSMLISPHGDGRIIALAIAKLGIATIEGSTFRDPMKALVDLIATLKSGTTVAITPDGPRGPRMRAAIGVVAAAQHGGVPILPLAYSTRRGIFFRKAWDRFLLPVPFDSGVARAGEPIEVPAQLNRETREAMRKLIEDRMNALTRDCDVACRRIPIEPA